MAFITNLPTKTNTTNKDINRIFQLLQEGEQKLQHQYGQRNAILVLGNTGSGKTTFTKWITNNDASLWSKDDPHNPGDYIINDTAQGNVSHFTSNTVFPELIFNNKTNTAFYDFPGFIDTRGVIHDIATTYFIKKVVDSVENVKIVLVVNYTSFTKEASRDDLRNLLQNTMTMVKNFDKFKNSVMLLVSKVNKDKNKISYEKIINALVSSMKSEKDDLQKEMNEKNIDNSRSIQLLDALLTHTGDVYPLIQLFRSPDMEGHLNEIPVMQDNKSNVTAALEKLSYAPKDNADIGYIIPKQSLIDVDTLVGTMRQHVLSSIESFGQQVQKHLYNNMSQFYDIVKLYDENTSVNNKLIDSKTIANRQEETEKCVKEIISGAILPGAGTDENLTNAMKYSSYLSFFYNITNNYTMHKSFKCADGLEDAIKYSEMSRKWYKFLRDLYDNKLSTYDVQKNISQSSCNDLAKFVTEGGEQNENKLSDVLELYVKKCDPRHEHEYEFKAMTMDKPKLNALRSLMIYTMKHRVDFSCDANTLLIKGQYVKLSDVNNYEEKCPTPPKVIKIFAAHKLFFDQDFEKVGEIALVIVAQTWDVLGSRKIVLRGEHGKPIDPLKASNGEVHGGKGQNGKPGLPGGPAGHFFGIGDNFNSLQYLTIASIGGDGGRGQDGGNGAQGNDGVTDFSHLSSMKVLSQRTEYGGSFWTKNKKIFTLYQGKEGEQGGTGGDGGVGGLGGSPGTITFIPTSHSDGIEFKNETAYGSGGLGGEGGMGGNGGRYGKNGEYCKKIRLNWGWLVGDDYDFKVLDSTAYAPSGPNGEANSNRNGIQNPRKGEPLTDKAIIVNEYKAYLREKMHHNMWESQLKEFLNKLESTRTTSNLNRRKRRRRSPNLTTLDHNNVDRVIPHDENKNFATNYAHKLNSPINTAVNLLANFLPLKFINPTLATTYKLIRNGIESTFKDWTSSQSSTHSATSTKFDEFSFHGVITLADFLIRCITKVKPYDNSVKTTDIIEVRAVMLDIITEFEAVLSRMPNELNLLKQSLEFDPVGLISTLEKKLIERDYKNLAKILFQSIDDNSHLNYTNFEHEMQPKIDLVVGKRGGENLFNCGLGVNNETQSTNRVCNVIGMRSDVNRAQPQKNSVLHLK